MFYGDFLSIPRILVITLQGRKTLFGVFLSFGNLPGLKLTQDFWSINIYHENMLEITKSTRGGPVAKQDRVARAPY
jgi:hypothetical protein